MIRKAVLISGIPKFWQNGLNSINTWFKDADIFIHAWDVSQGEISKEIAFSPQTYQLNDSLDNIINAFNPKKYEIEKLKDREQAWKLRREQYKKDNIVCSDSIQPFSMFYSLKRANHLKKEYEQSNNFVYDVVIRARFDSDIKTFNCNDLELKNKLIIPEGRDYSFCGVNDQFFFGDSHIMNEACQMYDYFDLICYNIRFFLPEACFGAYLNKIGFNNKLLRNNIIVNINNE